MRGARGLLVALLLCAAGSAVALGTAGRPWIRTETRVSTPTPERADAFVTTTSERSGSDVAPGVRALGLVSLAGGAALVAARGRARQAVGVALAAAGGGTAYLAARVAGPGRTGAVTVAALAGVAVAAGGLLAIVVGARWPSLGARFDRPAARAPARDELADAWDALDRGEETLD